MPGEKPHAPQSNVLASTGGYWIDPAFNRLRPFVGQRAAHASLNPEQGCVNCHNAKGAPSAPTARLIENPGRVGHAFLLNYDACTPCHADQAPDAVANLAAEISAMIDATRQRIASARLTPFLVRPEIEQLDAADLDLDIIQADRSNGAHNPNYARGLIQAANQLVDTVLASH